MRMNDSYPSTVVHVSDTRRTILDFTYNLTGNRHLFTWVISIVYVVITLMWALETLPDVVQGLSIILASFMALFAVFKVKELFSDYGWQYTLIASGVFAVIAVSTAISENQDTEEGGSRHQMTLGFLFASLFFYYAWLSSTPPDQRVKEYLLVNPLKFSKGTDVTERMRGKEWTMQDGLRCLKKATRGIDSYSLTMQTRISREQQSARVLERLIEQIEEEYRMHQARANEAKRTQAVEVRERFKNAIAGCGVRLFPLSNFNPDINFQELEYNPLFIMHSQNNKRLLNRTDTEMAALGLCVYMLDPTIDLTSYQSFMKVLNPDYMDSFESALRLTWMTKATGVQDVVENLEDMIKDNQSSSLFTGHESRHDLASHLRANPELVPAGTALLNRIRLVKRAVQEHRMDLSESLFTTLYTQQEIRKKIILYPNEIVHQEPKYRSIVMYHNFNQRVPKSRMRQDRLKDTVLRIFSDTSSLGYYKFLQEDGYKLICCVYHDATGMYVGIRFHDDTRPEDEPDKIAVYPTQPNGREQAHVYAFKDWETIMRDLKWSFLMRWWTDIDIKEFDWIKDRVFTVESTTLDRKKMSKILQDAQGQRAENVTASHNPGILKQGLSILGRAMVGAGDVLREGVRGIMGGTGLLNFIPTAGASTTTSAASATTTSATTTSATTPAGSTAATTSAPTPAGSTATATTTTPAASTAATASSPRV